MPPNLFKLGALLLSVAILLSGHGLQLTLLPIRADSLGWSTTAIGITASAYFSGFVIGCILIPGIVARIGHIRGFMVMGALATLALLGAGLLDSFAAWLVLRFATGFAFSGLYMVIESWLSEASTRDGRDTEPRSPPPLSLPQQSLDSVLPGRIPGNTTETALQP